MSADQITQEEIEMLRSALEAEPLTHDTLEPKTPTRWRSRNGPTRWGTSRTS